MVKLPKLLKCTMFAAFIAATLIAPVAAGTYAETGADPPRYVNERLSKPAQISQLLEKKNKTSGFTDADIETYYSKTIDLIVPRSVKNIVEEKLVGYKKDIEMLAQTIYNEARGVDKISHRAAVAWCVLNRIDDPSFSNSISVELTTPRQFAWFEDTPVREDLLLLAEDVVTRWLLEKEGIEDVGRVLPPDHLFFHGDRVYNYFRITFEKGYRWDWSLGTPYES